MKVLKGFVVLSVIVLSLIVIIGSCSNGEEEPAVEIPEEVEEVEEVLPDQGVIEQSILNIMQENFEGMADVELVDQTFIIIPTDPLIISDLSRAADGDPEAIADWQYLVETTQEASFNMKSNLPGYWIDIRNPANPENSLLIIQDGIVLYDFLDD